MIVFWWFLGKKHWQKKLDGRQILARKTGRAATTNIKDGWQKLSPVVIYGPLYMPYNKFYFFYFQTSSDILMRCWLSTSSEQWKNILLSLFWHLINPNPSNTLTAATTPYSRSSPVILSGSILGYDPFSYYCLSSQK